MCNIIIRIHINNEVGIINKMCTDHTVNKILNRNINNGRFIKIITINPISSAKVARHKLLNCDPHLSLLTDLALSLGRRYEEKNIRSPVT